MTGDVGFSRVKRKQGVLRCLRYYYVCVCYYGMMYDMLWVLLSTLAEILIPFLVARINCYTSILIG